MRMYELAAKHSLYRTSQALPVSFLYSISNVHYSTTAVCSVHSCGLGLCITVYTVVLLCLVVDGGTSGAHNPPIYLPASLPLSLPASLPASSLPPPCLLSSLPPPCLLPSLPACLPACLPLSFSPCLPTCLLPPSLPACLPLALPACLPPSLAPSRPACLPK